MSGISTKYIPLEGLEEGVRYSDLVLVGGGLIREKDGVFIEAIGEDGEMRVIFAGGSKGSWNSRTYGVTWAFRYYQD